MLINTLYAFSGQSVSPNIVPFDITVCAVAQHCYNGDVSFLWEKWKL